MNEIQISSSSDNSDLQQSVAKVPLQKACDFVPISIRNYFSSFASTFKLYTKKWWQGRKSI
jgi:hypothetical protein